MSIDQILGAAASVDAARYRPQHVIDAVNALLPLGKEPALAAIERYLAQQKSQADPQTGLFLVLRVLFEVPPNPGYHPTLALGGSFPPPPAQLQQLPLFPVVLIDDRPLLLVSGFVLGGLAESVTTHIRHFRAVGELRRKPLAPSQPAQAVLDQFRAIYQTAYGKPPSAHEISFIEAQLNTPE